MDKRGKSGNGNSIGLVCHYCSKAMSLEKAMMRGWRTECDACGANMYFEYDYESPSLRAYVKYLLDKQPGLENSLFFQFSPLLPLKNETMESVQKTLYREKARLPGNTQLKQSSKHQGLYLKCEQQNPTGSFKDEGTICEFSMAYELGLCKSREIVLASYTTSISSPEEVEDPVNALQLASTGNMGVSSLYYARALGIPLVLHISKSINPQKLTRMEKFGLSDSSSIVRRCVECSEISEGYDAQQNHVREQFEKAPQGSRMWVGDTSLRIEGCKVIGYEIFSQLSFVPDNIVVPIGNGTLLCALWKAFDELKKLEITEKIPRFFGVVVPERLHDKVSALGVRRPSDLSSAFKIIRDTNGSIQSLDERSIAEAQNALLKEGINAEPAGALPYAFYENARMSPDEITVALVTG